MEKYLGRSFLGKKLSLINVKGKCFVIGLSPIESNIIEHNSGRAWWPYSNPKWK